VEARSHRFHYTDVETSVSPPPPSRTGCFTDDIISFRICLSVIKRTMLMPRAWKLDF
jgi:hypothetical protein